FLLLRRSPSSALFPYTTLFRSSPPQLRERSNAVNLLEKSKLGRPIVWVAFPTWICERPRRGARWSQGSWDEISQLESARDGWGERGGAKGDESSWEAGRPARRNLP